MAQSTSHSSSVGSEELLFHTPMGDAVYFAREAMIISFAGRRGVVSSSNLNGGYRNDLRSVFNHSVGRDPNILQKRCPGLKGANIIEHYAVIASELGLDPEHTTGMGTAALIENHARAERTYHGVTVQAIATAGIDVNGGRAGDKASYDEFEQRSLLPPPGTINVFLFIDAYLDPGALTRALITATEAKTVALQELMAPSRYSEGLATGSGTDSLIAVCNEESPVVLYGAGKHVLLGEMIGQSVKEAVTKALDRQSGMNAQRQSSFLQQGIRYGLGVEELLALYQARYPEVSRDAATLRRGLQRLATDSHLSASIASILHLVDQWRWGLISWASLIDLSQYTLSYIAQRYRLDSCELSISREEATRYELLLDELRQLLLQLLDRESGHL